MTMMRAVRADLPRRLGRLFPSALAAGLLSGCSATGALNALEPRGGVAVVRDIPYAQGERRRLDVYQPKRAKAPTPVVLFFYGGNWDSGDKADYAFVGRSLARRGYLTLVADYRLYPTVKWPDFLRDGALAARWAQDNAAAFGGDSGKLVLMGHSAGAYNAVELAVDDRWLAEVGMRPASDVAAVVGLAGPYDFLPLRNARLMTIFGPEKARADTQPINHVDAPPSPMWLATGRDDKIVDPGNAARLAQKVRKVGGQVEVRVYDRPGHALMVGALAAPLRFIAPVRRDLSHFIDIQTGKEKP